LMLAVASAGRRGTSRIDLVAGLTVSPELIETGRVLTERCKLGDRVALQVGNALELPYPDQTFDVVWCQNVTMNIADKVGLLASVYRVLKRGGLYTATEYSVGPGGEVALLLISLACLSSTNGVSFPKIRSGRIRAVRENQTIIQCDVCDHLPAWNIYRRSVQVAAPA
jgi:ubiquinone/menaquinone biosynthesis C-methylase UbiE